MEAVAVIVIIIVLAIILFTVKYSGNKTVVAADAAPTNVLDDLEDLDN